MGKGGAPGIANNLCKPYTALSSTQQQEIAAALRNYDCNAAQTEADLANNYYLACDVSSGTKIAYLLHTGEVFPESEATTLFFGITKLFQHKDASLRQMVYLVIKELAHTAQDVIMVTSSIMKDTAVGNDVVYRPNAIRTLCRIIDVRSRM